MKKKIGAVLVVAALAAVAAFGTLAYFTDQDANKNVFKVGNIDLVLDEGQVGEDGKWIDEGATRVHENEYTQTIVPGYKFDKDPTIHNVGTEPFYAFLDMNLNKYNSLLWVMAADASYDTAIDFTIFTVDEDNNKVIKAEFQNAGGQFSTEKFMRAMAANKAIFQQVIGKWFIGIDHTKWQVMEEPFATDEGKTLTLRFGYIGGDNGILAATESTVPFMQQFTMPASVTQKMIDEGKTIGKMAHTFNDEASEFNMNFTAYAIQSDGDNITDVNAAYAALFTAGQPGAADGYAHIG